MLLRCSNEGGVGHVACMGEARNAHEILSENMK
jgi:hypothetical protein